MAPAVPFGANTATHEVGSNEGMPTSAAVGTSGRAGFRFGIAIDPATPTTLYASGGALYKSIDRGVTWTPLLPDTYLSVTVDPSSPGTVYAVATVQEDKIKDVERADRPDAGDQRRLAVAVEHLEREAAYEARKHDKAAAAEHKRHWKQIHQAAKAMYRDRERNRG